MIGDPPKVPAFMQKFLPLLSCQEAVDIALGDLGTPLYGKDCPYIHRLVLVPDCLCVAYAASISETHYFGQFLDLICFHLWDMMAVLM